MAIIQAAERSDWSSADTQVTSLKSQVPPIVPGDRKLARQLNSQGLDSLARHDFVAAISSFTSAQKADPADIEVSNNLGSAYQQAGQNAQAVDALNQTLLYSPTRAPAWANLAQTYAQAGNLAASEACARLTLRYSKNPVKTVTFMTTVVSANPSGTYEQILAKVLRDQPPLAPLVANTGAPAQPSQAGTAPASPQNQQMEEAVRGMLVEGQTCLANQNYTCAITNASNVLRLSPDNSSAYLLKSRAESAQSEALKNIEIH
jgi:tetratricopeptide (TPR) repeat protein